LQHLQCWVHFELIVLIFLTFFIIFRPNETQTMEHIKKIDFICVFHSPCNYTELNMKEISQYYECSLQLLLVTRTVCQYSACTHIMNTGGIYCIFMSLTVRQIQYIPRRQFRLPSQL